MKKEALVTCEFSIHKKDISELEQFVKNVDLKLGKWITMECEAYVCSHGEGYAHASIERFDTIKKLKIVIITLKHYEDILKQVWKKN